jgi:glycosyltransferase involved in cell wall biosynthesis
MRIMRLISSRRGMERAGERGPVRVCFLIDELSRAGTETQLVALIQHLDRQRVAPYLCLLRGDKRSSRALEPDACPILRLNVRSLRAPAALGAAVRLARYLRRNRIEVLQVYFRDSAYFGVLVGRLAGVGCIVRTRNNLGYTLTRLDCRLGRLCNHLVDYTLANCAACRDAAVAEEGQPRKAAVVMENGVDLARFAGVSTIRGLRTPVRVGILANLRPVKELDVFLRAAAQVCQARRDMCFTIGGEGELRAALQRMVWDLGLDQQVALAGAVSDVPAFLAEQDICVLCSRSEGLSNAVLEYMAAGRAIVATAVGGTPHLIEPGRHGLLVPAGDAGALAAALRRLLDEPGLAGRLAAAARQRAHDNFSRERMVERFEAFFEACARSSAPGAYATGPPPGPVAYAPGSERRVVAHAAGSERNLIGKEAHALAAARLHVPVRAPTL